MNESRRSFLQASVVAGTVAMTGLPTLSFAADDKQAGVPLEILVLGGTGFIGPHMVSEALRRGHNVTLFNRGKTNDELFRDLESIHGDRSGDLDGLKGRKWDAVIDNSGYVPRHVENSARVLAPNVGFYLYISTVAVYADFDRLNDESSPLATLDDESIEEVNGDTYGPLKALCEKRAAAEIAADRLSIIRPTYICGPGDRTDRFTYYPVRARQGGVMAWPGSPSHEMQIVDVRDLANFTLDCVDRQTSGIYNAVNPVGSYNFGALLTDCEALTGVEVEPVWLNDAFIEENNAQVNFPIYYPATGRDNARVGFSAQRALQAGLQIRPERETVRDLLAWWDTLPAERQADAKFRMTPEQEAELIELFLA